MPRDFARCPYCHEWLVLDATVGFPYARTRARLHLQICRALPEAEDRLEIEALADRIAENAIAYPT